MTNSPTSAYIPGISKKYALTIINRDGDYVRSALKTGLELEDNLGVNPYALGVIGSTDSHTGLATAEEANFWGKMASGATPERNAGPRNQIVPTT